jgi:hypothetical protein
MMPMMQSVAAEHFDCESRSPAEILDECEAFTKSDFDTRNSISFRS